MPKGFLLLLISLLLWPVPAPAQDNPKAIVEKAVQAMGGLDKLTRAKGTIRKVKGTTPTDTFMGETFSQSPDKLKMVGFYTNGGTKITERILLLKEGKGWFRLDGTTINLDNDEMAQIKRARHADKVAGLVTLLKDKGYTLSFLEDTKVKEKPVKAIKVQYQGQPDIHLYFDKTSGFLIKSWQKFHDPDINKEVIHENYFSKYEPVNPLLKEELILKDGKLPLKGPDLVKWLSARILSPEVKDKIGKLIGDLKADSFAVRTKATAELKKLGLEATSILQNARQDEEAEVVLRLEHCLAHYAKDPARLQVPAVVRFLAFHKPAGAAETLLNYLPSAPSESIRDEIQAALFDLAQLPGKPNPALLKALDDSDPLKRSAAQAALGKDGGVYAKKPSRRLLMEGVRIATHCDLYRNSKLDLQLDILDLQFFNRLEEQLFTIPN